MSAIRSRGRRGFTVVPNWRWEDQSLDTYDLRIAGWLASHADTYLAEHVCRNEIARRTGVSGPKVSDSLAKLTTLGIVEIEETPAATGKRWVITFDFDAWESGEVGAEPREPRSRAAEAPLPRVTQERESHAPATRGDPEEEEKIRGEQRPARVRSMQRTTPNAVIPRSRPDLFAELVELWPRDENMTTAVIRWDELHMEHGGLRTVADGQLRSAVEAVLASDDVEDGYVMHFVNWLDKRRWQDRRDKYDEIREQKRAKKRGPSLEERRAGLLARSAMS